MGGCCINNINFCVLYRHSILPDKYSEVGKTHRGITFAGLYTNNFLFSILNSLIGENFFDLNFTLNINVANLIDAFICNNVRVVQFIIE